MHYDIVIVGAGLVGTSAAVALTEQGFKVAIIDAAPSPNKLESLDWDNRIYAISPGNIQWLKQLNVWQKLNKGRISAIQKMQVWADATESPLIFDAYEANAENLGVILENSALQQALSTRLVELGVDVQFGQHIKQLQYLKDIVELELESGAMISSQLLIAADGGSSWVRQHADISVTTQLYDQVGVVANFETELAHGAIARQWFGEDGILAWLPMVGNRISIVWSTALPEKLMQLDSEQLALKVAEAGQFSLGQLKTITAAAAFPLRKQTAAQLVKPRLALLGDAAHQVHPLAGQGVNLGFRDVVQLGKVLGLHANGNQDIGDFYLLRRYERARKSDMLAMGFVTHGLKTLFASEQLEVKRLRNWGLQTVGRANWLKRQLSKHAML